MYFILNRSPLKAKCLGRYLNTSKFAHFNRIQKKLSVESSSQGLFGIPELVSHEGFETFQEQAVKESNALVDEATSRNRKRKMVQIFDDLSDSLCRVADLAEFVRVGHPDRKYNQAAEKASFGISSLVEKFNINYELFKGLKDTVDNGDILPLNETEFHVAKLFLFDFEQCGIHLDAETREQVAKLNDKILNLGANFMHNAQAPRMVLKDTIPNQIRSEFPSNGDRILMHGIHAEASDPLVREVAYKVFLHPDDFQMSQLNDLLSSRHRLATLSGFKTYAHRSLRGSIAETPENVNSFLTYLSQELKPRAEIDYKEMLSMKQKCSRHANKLDAWDVPYYLSQGKMNKFVLNPKEYQAYLSLTSCMEGLDMIFNKLYGVNLEVVEPRPGEVWHDSVTKLAVKDLSVSDEPIGIIYCDLFERPRKPYQDCHFTIQGGRRKADGSYQIPKVVLMLNLPQGSPTLLTPSLMDNLFHEMGHAMHSMLARTEFQHVTGTRCATDLAEVPSILMEYFASDPRVVSLFARHYQTGEPMPDGMAADLEASRIIFQASETQLQVFYAFLDHTFHLKHPLKDTTTQILKRMQNRHYGIPYVPKTAWHLRFTHLVGYGAKYYSYLMSRAVAASFWHKVFKADPLSRSSGMMYRDKVLAHGGSLPATQLVKDFLQVDQLSTQELAEALIKDIDRR